MSKNRTQATPIEVEDAPSSATSVSRRRFLAGATVVTGLAVVAVACGNDDDGQESGGSGGQTGDTTATTGAAANADLDTATVAAGLEKLAVDTYAAAGMLATQGKLGPSVPDAVVEFVTTAGRQHQEHLDSWNRVLTGGGRQAVTAPNAQLKPLVDAAAVKLNDVPGAANLALRLEDYAAQTYLKVIPTLRSPDAVRLASQILVVDQQHQAILRYVVGLYPVGSGVVRESKDFAPSDPQTSLITG